MYISNPLRYKNIVNYVHKNTKAAEYTFKDFAMQLQKGWSNTQKVRMGSLSYGVAEQPLFPYTP